jgi:hypothetical protein
VTKAIFEVAVVSVATELVGLTMTVEVVVLLHLGQHRLVVRVVLLNRLTTAGWMSSRSQMQTSL